MTATKIVETARALGMKPEEIVAVEDSPAGDVITNHRGVRYVDVPADNPDGEGKTGLMLLVRPATYQGDFPVYEQPLDENDADQASDADDPDAVPDGSPKVVLAWVAGDAERAASALEHELAHKARKGVIAELEAILAQAAELAERAPSEGDANEASDADDDQGE